jgi:hypothetical protein
MTRDEYRARCIEAIAYGQKWEEVVEKDVYRCHAAKILDSLHGIARVVPIEATEEMSISGIDAAPGQTWRAMSAAGDLTNPPEQKP